MFLDLLRFISSMIVYVVYVVHDAPATAAGLLEIYSALHMQ
jgi:hypothetical protein